MKNLILIMVVCACNILLFQNFTTVTDQEKDNWGAAISESNEPDNVYDDFQSALNQSQENLDKTKETWQKEFEEMDTEKEEEVGAVIGDKQEVY